MTESPQNQSSSHPQVSMPRLDSATLRDLPSDTVAENGQEVLQHLEETIQGSTGAISYFVNSTARLAPGQMIDQKYQVIKLIGQGKVGLIYEVRHILLDKIFAIKVLSPEEPLQDVSSQRFQREALAASSLNHPNIIAVHDFGIMGDGTLYLVMEHLVGETLADLLKRQERLDFKTALPIFLQACLALEYAHDKGLVHRDLKPSNIMLVKDYKGNDLVKVIDFGIAKFTIHKPDLKTITKPGQIFGSPLYMSPEQCQGKKPDHRSDIYSLGCVMYETLCGTPPLMGDTSLNTIYKHVNELPSPFSQHAREYPLPKDLEAIVFRALAKQPENRYQSARELLQTLESFNQYYQHNTSRFKQLGDLALTAMKRTVLPGPNIQKLQVENKSISSAMIPLLLFSLICLIITFCLFLR